MRVFVAGGSGTIGVPLVRALIAAGHQVTAMTRSPEKQASLRAPSSPTRSTTSVDRIVVEATTS